jgi:hypothetical protein
VNLVFFIGDINVMRMRVLLFVLHSLQNVSLDLMGMYVKILEAFVSLTFLVCLYKICNFLY